MWFCLSAQNLLFVNYAGLTMPLRECVCVHVQCMACNCDQTQWNLGMILNVLVKLVLMDFAFDVDARAKLSVVVVSAFC